MSSKLSLNVSEETSSVEKACSLYPFLWMSSAMIPTYLDSVIPMVMRQFFYNKQLKHQTLLSG